VIELIDEVDDALSTSQPGPALGDLFRLRAKIDGAIVKALADAGRSGAYRHDGATSLESWTAERFGVSTSTARAYVHLSEKAPKMPHVIESLCAGDLSFDKVRAVADVVTPGTDKRLVDQAKENSVRDLVDIARTMAARAPAPHRQPPPPQSDDDRRYLRFNDTHRTINIQLPADAYAESKASLEARAKELRSDGETPWDQRLCDGFLGLIRSSDSGSTSPAGAASRYVVVAHVPLASLLDETGAESALAGELEHVGLIDGDMVRRIACDATIVVGVDDDVGHTMYEGRARRFPSGTQRREVRRRDRHCRFPGCANVTFAAVHHIVPWEPGGTTDLANMVLLCEFHHGVVHRKGWTMEGNANEELTITGPGDQVMTSRPSPLWTRVTEPR
jgi:Domain of unknown function (DUF222)/HNH endonuclease